MKGCITIMRKRDSEREQQQRYSVPPWLELLLLHMERLSNLGLWQNPSWGGKSVHTNHPGVILGSHPAFPREYPVCGGSLRVWEMCYCIGDISVYGLRGVMICCVSPNLRTCPISEGINGVMAIPRPCKCSLGALRKGSQTYSSQKTSYRKGKKKFIRNNPIN